MPSSTLSGRVPSPVRVLVVDDDPLLRQTIVRLLTLDGFDVSDADSVDAALSLLMADGEVSLVISDIDMPSRDGRELLSAIRTHYPDIAVVMLTGSQDVETAVTCLKLGARDYLAKPVQSQELRARVEKALADREGALEIRRVREHYLATLESEVKALARKNQAMFLAQVQMAVTMLEAKNNYTRGHSARVAESAAATARHLGLAPGLVDQVRLGGELHDIGKIGTPDAVLNKPGALTDEEFAVIRRHTLDGEAMLSVLRADHPEVLQIVRWHHEHMDGNGFPDGLVGEDIPFPARIVSVADAFDAMTSARTYGSVRSVESACQELRRVAGRQFDPVVVDAFLAVQPAVAPRLS